MSMYQYIGLHMYAYSDELCITFVNTTNTYDSCVSIGITHGINTRIIFWIPLSSLATLLISHMFCLHNTSQTSSHFAGGVLVHLPIDLHG